MEDKIDLQVGDRVTYKIIDKNRIITEIVTNDNVGLSGICWFKEHLENKHIEILKIERPKYELIEEKKELLTEEEKEFVKDMCKYYDVAYIQFYGTFLTLSSDIDFTLLSPNYPKNLKFENVKTHERYTLKELGLD